MSLGAPVGGQVIEDAVANAFNNGVVVVAACGNGNTSDCDFPGAYNSYVIAVGATAYNETRAPYSSFGSSLDIMAPGGNTAVDLNGDGFADGVLQNTFSDTPVDFAYWFFQGTSMATPHIAGVAALLLAKDSGLTPTEVRDAMEQTALDLGTTGRDDTFGWGLVNAKSALNSIVTVSITLDTNGTIPFGIVAQGATVTSTNDVQTVTITAGPADLSVRSTDFSDGSNVWTLGVGNGADQVKWEFSEDGTTWETFTSANTLISLDVDVPEGGSRNLYLRLTTPTSSSSGNEHSATVTFVATTPE